MPERILVESSTFFSHSSADSYTKEADKLFNTFISQQKTSNRQFFSTEKKRVKKKRTKKNATKEYLQ